MDLKYVLEAKLTGITDERDIENKGKKRLKNNSNFWLELLEG